MFKSFLYNPHTKLSYCNIDCAKDYLGPFVIIANEYDLKKYEIESCRCHHCCHTIIAGNKGKKQIDKHSELYKFLTKIMYYLHTLQYYYEIKSDFYDVEKKFDEGMKKISELKKEYNRLILGGK